MDRNIDDLPEASYAQPEPPSHYRPHNKGSMVYRGMKMAQALALGSALSAAACVMPQREGVLLDKDTNQPVAVLHGSGSMSYEKGADGSQRSEIGPGGSMRIGSFGGAVYMGTRSGRYYSRGIEFWGYPDVWSRPSRYHTHHDLRW